MPNENSQTGKEVNELGYYSNYSMIKIGYQEGYYYVISHLRKILHKAGK
jgi:hypothetical protein